MQFIRYYNSSKYSHWSKVSLDRKVLISEKCNLYHVNCILNFVKKNADGELIHIKMELAAPFSLFIWQTIDGSANGSLVIPLRPMNLVSIVCSDVFLRPKF